MSVGGKPIGDPLTDNRQDDDDYRFHDVFHMAYAAVMGWSPTLRRLLKRKRKSDPWVDETQDGARAVLIEEGVATWIFNHGQRLKFFEGIGTLDYRMLKTIKEFVRGYEAERCPLWCWEEAILQGYEAFRAMRAKPVWSADRRSRRAPAQVRAPAVTGAEGFVSRLADVELPNVFNPYQDVCRAHDEPDAPSKRRANLTTALAAALELDVRTIWIARDLGYRGGRRTGLALTDEAHLHEHARLLGRHLSSACDPRPPRRGADGHRHLAHGDADRRAGLHVERLPAAPPRSG